MSGSWNRPKINIPKTKMEWGSDIIGYLSFLGSVVFLIFSWGMLPEEVPAHYNASGEVDRWGSKLELLILPIVGLFTAFLMQVFEKFPETHNYPQRINEENAAEFYLNSRKMVNLLKNICFILFAVILVQSITVALGWSNGFGAWVLPLIISSSFIPIVLGLLKQRKIK